MLKVQNTVHGKKNKIDYKKLSDKFDFEEWYEDRENHPYPTGNSCIPLWVKVLMNQAWNAALKYGREEK
jgi:hypothetical protein